MTAGIKVTNIGNITVQVVDLGWTARQWQPNLSPDAFDFGHRFTKTVDPLALVLADLRHTPCHRF